MTCPVCDGARMVLVSEDTARGLTGPLVVPPEASPELEERLAREWDARLAAARNTVYPCRECNPGAFSRWLTGAYASTLATNGRGGEPRRVEPPPALPERKDVDP